MARRTFAAVATGDRAALGFCSNVTLDDLSKTTIKSPIDGTVTKLKSQLGERVLGTSFNMGTEMMTIAKLDDAQRAHVQDLLREMLPAASDGSITYSATALAGKARKP